MVKCKKCGRRFKNKDALGGHTSHAHPRVATAAAVTPATAGQTGAHGAVSADRAAPNVAASAAPIGQAPPADSGHSEGTARPQPAPSAVKADPSPGASAGSQGTLAGQASQPVPEEQASEAEQIDGYLSRGYTFDQLTGELGFKATTVRRAIARRVPPQAAPEAKEDEPQVEGRLPVTVKRAEVITPEGIIQSVQDGSREWQLRTEGMMLLRAAQKMNMDDVEIMKGQAEAQAKMMKPLLDTMIEISREQDAAARRAMGSNEDVAQRTALTVAQRLSADMDSLRSQVAAASAPDRVARMLNLMKSLPQMIQTGQQLMGAMGMQLPGQSQPGALPLGTAQSQAQEGWQPPPIERHSIAELEAKDAG